MEDGGEYGYLGRCWLGDVRALFDCLLVALRRVSDFGTVFFS